MSVMIFNQHNIKMVSLVLPEKKIFKEEFNYLNETKITKIKENLGFDCHYIADSKTYSSDLAIKAISKILENFDKSHLDMLISITPSPDFLAPQTANIIHKKLQLSDHTILLDKTGFCSSVLQGLFFAFVFLDNPNINNIILTYSQTVSKKIQDDNFYRNISDNACAFLIQKSNSPSKNIYAELNLTSFTEKETIPIEAYKQGASYFYVNNGIFFEESQVNYPLFYKKLMLKTKEIEYYFLHSPNQFFYKKMVENLSIPCNKLPKKMAYNFFGSLGANTIFFDLHINKEYIFDGSDKKLFLGSQGGGITLNALTLNLSNFNSTLIYL
ncbi:hypothetical protein L8T90_01915 [Campylobacter sp. RKI_CA19_01121]|uniref:hypothetical protein n=1 Tax=Campylobacter sp. RKI_CA19_01121 TaxID=2911626 RepID=UPI0021E85424|nr:hypothetical protein [Campylobacter sp. RKI_CA19_01121]MCV3336730.1 hypothetical protein [Campylobacter sp. RKI_CA19_01121]